MKGRKLASQPTNWKFILGTTAGALVLGFLFLKFFLLPWQQNKKALDRVEEDYEQQHRAFQTFMKEKQRLESSRLLGLPRLPNLEESSSKYTQYLKKLMTDCGFPDANVDIKPTGNEEKPKSPPAQGAKKPLHIILAFQVDAKGDWTNLTKMLEKFQRTPLLHRLRNLTVTPDTRGAGKSNPKLAIMMNVEAMVVHKNQQRPVDLWGIDPQLLFVDSALALWQNPAGVAWAGVLRGQALLLPEMPARRYADLAWVNPFVGGKPRNPFVEEKPIAKKAPKRSEFRLAFTNPSAQRALLLSGSTEKNTVVTLAGLETFSVFDGIDTVKGRVLRVDLGEVFVEVGGKIFGIGYEKTFSDYLKTPLTLEEQKQRGLVKEK
jgi:hypothetical protein